MAWIWMVAAGLYGLFRAWYDNWRGPLTRKEIDAFLARARDTGADRHNDLAVVEAFLSHDDGREFFMLNLVKVQAGMVDDPVTGVPVRGPEMMSRYTGPFLRGGHPALVAALVQIALLSLRG